MFSKPIGVGLLAALILAYASSPASALELVPAPGSPYATTSPAFEPSPGGFLGGEAVGDFNGDGLADVAVVNSSGLPIFSGGESVTILLGSPSGALAVAPGSPVALYSGGEFATQGPIAVGDFNDDGKLDLAVIDETHHTVYILLGNGRGEFSPAPGSPISFSGSAGSIAVGDFEGNGQQDIAIAGEELNILLGDGHGEFSPAPESPIALSAYDSSMVAGDFNGDGRSDLALTTNANNVLAYLSVGGGRFQLAPDSPPETGPDPRAIATSDLTGNGRLDLAVANGGSDNVTVLLGAGNGEFTPDSGSPFTVPIGSAGPGEVSAPGSIVVGDFTCNGTPDLAVADWSGPSRNLAILQGNGSGGFSNAPGSPFPAGPNPGPIAVGDFDGDGSPDVAAVNAFLGRVTVLENATSGYQCEPLPPSGGHPSGPPTISSGSPTTSGRPSPPVIHSLALLARTVTAKRGAALHFRLSQAGHVVVELERTSFRYRRGKTHELIKPVGTITLAGVEGANSLTIKRVAGHLLAPGQYRLLVFTELDGQRSQVHSLSLTVRRP